MASAPSSSAIPVLGRGLRHTRDLSADIAWGLAVPVALLALWWVAAAREWVSPQALPPPGQVWEALDYHARDGDLFPAIGISLRRVLYGFLAGAGIGLPLGLARRLTAPRPGDTVSPPRFHRYIRMERWIKREAGADPRSQAGAAPQR